MRPTAVPPDFDGIPLALRAEPRWTLWSYLQRDDKWTKTPMQPSGRYAKTNDPATWASFDTVADAFLCGYPVAGNGSDILKLQFDGIGFVLGGPFAGIDDDDCSMPFATAAYVEVSPSGLGRKFFGRGSLSVEWKGGRVTKRWPNARFFAVTGRGHGDVTAPLPVFEQPFSLASRPAFIPIGDTRGVHPEPPRFPPRSDDDVVRAILASAQGSKFAALMRGEHDGDHSAADLALCSILMYWTQGDRDQSDRLFRASKLCRDKWTTRADYRTLTLNRAETR